MVFVLAAVLACSRNMLSKATTALLPQLGAPSMKTSRKGMSVIAGFVITSAGAATLAIGIEEAPSAKRGLYIVNSGAKVRLRTSRCSG